MPGLSREQNRTARRRRGVRRHNGGPRYSRHPAHNSDRRWPRATAVCAFSSKRNRLRWPSQTVQSDPPHLHRFGVGGSCAIALRICSFGRRHIPLLVVDETAQPLDTGRLRRHRRERIKLLQRFLCAAGREGFCAAASCRRTGVWAGSCEVGAAGTGCCWLPRRMRPVAEFGGAWRSIKRKQSYCKVRTAIGFCLATRTSSMKEANSAQSLAQKSEGEHDGSPGLKRPVMPALELKAERELQVTWACTWRVAVDGARAFNVSARVVGCWTMLKVH